MGTTTASSVTLTEYRSTVYEPDMDYVDGELEDRNVGELDHSKLQKRLLALLEKAGFEFAYPELRLKVAPTRYRIPDVCVYTEEPTGQVPTAPPLLAIEVLSPEDRVSRIQVKLDDYITMGCPCVWVVDPALRRAYCYDGRASTRVVDELAHPSNKELRLRRRMCFRRRFIVGTIQNSA